MFTKGLETQPNEISIDALPINGTIPTWLNGSLLRNGPAQFEVGTGKYNHWFDGLAMLHRFGFDQGQVSYRNKFLQSPEYKGNNAAGKISFGTFATDPCRNIFQRVMSIFNAGEPGHNGNVNLTKLADQFVALTETPLPVEFDAQTLETVGVVKFADDIEFVSSTAHPHFDPQRNAGVQHLIEYGRESTYRFAYIPNEKPLRREKLSQIKVGQPGYVHSFGMTENYLILAEFPFVVNPLKILLSGKPFIENFAWKPGQGTRFLIVDKNTGELVREVKGDACFSFHHINAFEDGDDIILDMSTYEDAQLVNELYLANLRGKGGGKLSFPECRRYRLPADGSRATYETISEYGIELPRINYRYNGKPYRYVYGGSLKRRDNFLDALVKIDMHTGQGMQWHEEGMYPGEPVFVAAPDAIHEDEGVLLSVVLDSAANSSFLLVLDAATFTEIGRASVPQHIPLGFHGQYFS
ncbi:MAG: carotenoid oxygenase family protein [Candidatus Promineifilaceae bacterium]